MNIPQAIDRNLDLLESIRRHHNARRGPETPVMSLDAASRIVLAIRLEQLAQDFVENIHRAGEGT